jgi:hypothetical protein
MFALAQAVEENNKSSPQFNDANEVRPFQEIFFSPNINQFSGCNVITHPPILYPSGEG